MAQKNILKYIILGLLNQKELAGYDLKKLFAGELNDFWSSNHSQIYPELRRMEEEGLIASRSRTVGTKLEKKYYRLTDAGKKALAAWMHEPLSSLVPSRDEFTMKLYLVEDHDDPLIPKLIQEDIARHQEKYDYLLTRWNVLFKTPEARKAHFGHALILSRALEREKQRLTWLKEMQAEIAENKRTREHSSSPADRQSQPDAL